MPAATSETRTAILTAAVEAFTEKGFDRTSVAEIVKNAGVAQGTFYLYFASKNQLVPAIASSIIETFLQRLKSVPQQTLTTVDGLLTTLIEVTYAITAEQQRVIAFCYSGMAHFGHASQWEEIYAPYYQWLQDKLSVLQTAGRLSPQLDLVYAAIFIVGLLEHSAENHYLFGADPKERERSQQELLSFVRRAIQA